MKKSTELKEFLLSTWAINHSTVISVIIGLFLFLGIYSFFTLPRENFPDIQETEIYVSSVYPGNTAEDIERLITDPLEESLKTVQNVKKITSSSVEDFSIITVQFDENISVDLAKQKIQEEIDQVISDTDWPTFNNSKVQPNAFEFIYSEELPIVNVSLMGDFPLDKLKFYAEELKDAIEELPEIIKVDMRGVEDFEVEVSLDIFKMNASKVSFNNIVNSLNRENKTISAGNILGDGQRRNIRIIGEISKPSDLEKFVVKTQNGSVYLGDIAKINFKEKEKTSFARSFGETAIMLDVKKKSR
jgi:multidrug efflux pump subunit AcrB